MADFKIRLSEKSTDILKELGPRLFSDVGAGASIENKKRQLAKKDRFEKNETGKKEEVQQVTIQQVPLDAIVDSPYQCRGSYSTTAIEEIAHSIKEIGLRQIPEARKVGTNGTFQLAYGHMRFRAFKKLAKTDKTITTMPLDVKEISDDTMCLISLEENIRRQDITPIDIARAVELYMATFKEATETELARRLKMTQGHVSNMRRVLRLPAEILTKIEEGKINFTMARELLIFEGKQGTGSESNWSRTEQRSVSTPRDDKWLMISAVKGVGGQYGNSATVDGIKKSIYHVCESHFRHLDKDQSYYSRENNPLFDTRAAGCLKCEHMVRANETKTQIKHYCTDTACWDKKQAVHVRAQAAKAKKEMEADLAQRINTQEKERPTAATISQEIPEDYEEDMDTGEDPRQEAIEAEQELDEAYLEQAKGLGVDEELAAAIPDEQREGALRTWNNLREDPRELCCRSCLSAGICDGRPKGLIGSGEQERWTCPDRMKLGSVEAVSRKATQELPAALKGLDKGAAGTRAQILDILSLRASSWNSELKQGHVWLNAEGREGDLERMENPDECLQTCTKGFHYAFDSSASEKRVLYVCTDPKCVSRKKGAFTRAKNARATAKKRAEGAAIKEAVAATTTLDKPRLMLILTASLKGRHTGRSYSSQGDDKELVMAKLLGYEHDNSGYGSERDIKNDAALQEAMEKLSEEELAKIVVHFMLLMLTYDGEILNYKIHTAEALRKMGVNIPNIPKPLAQVFAGKSEVVGGE